MGSFKRKNSRFGAVLFASILIWSTACSSARAQWVKLATFPGYISYCKFLTDSVGFVGLGMSPGMPLPQPPINLYRTTDGGVTWKQVVTPPGYSGEIGNIDMLDSVNGLLAMTVFGGSGRSALWRTTDGGLSWNETSLMGSGTGVWVTDKAIVVSDLFGNGHVSVDGGATWNDDFLGSTNDVVFVDSLHGAVCDYRGANSLYTADGGLTWAPSYLNVESWSLYAVKGTPDFYAAPEGPTHPYNGLVYRSSDYGASWVSIATLPFKFTGDMEGIDSSYLFLQAHWWDRSISQGFSYSTDQGKTWTNIGGPNQIADTRFAVWGNCRDGITLYGYGDVNGNDLYRYKMPFAGGGPSELSISNLSNLEASSCTPVDTFVPFQVAGCLSHPMLDSVWLTGSSAFTFPDPFGMPHALAASDTIPLQFVSGENPDTSFLHLRFDLGTGVRDTVILLSGMASPFGARPQSLHREAASANYGQLDSLPMAIDLSAGVNIDSLWPFVTDIQATFAFDSSVVQFQSYLAPTGWLLTSLASHGNNVDFSIHQTSAAATRPLLLGMALFSPATSQLASTWVTLPRFDLQIGKKDITLCVTQNEDSHWSVKTLGAQSDVGTPDAAMAEKEISVYPNPAADRLFIRNPFAHTVEVRVYDAIGRSVLSSEVPANSTITMSLASLPRGTYLVSGHSGTCVIVSHE